MPPRKKRSPEVPDLRARARAEVDAALRAGADEAEAYVCYERSISVAIEADHPTAAVTSIDFGVGLRVRRDGRIGFASTTGAKLDRGLARKALAVATLASPIDLHFSPRGKLPKVAWAYDKRIEKLGPDEAVDAATALIESGRSVDDRISIVGGDITFAWERFALHSSEGRAFQGRSSLASAYASALVGGDEPVNHQAHELSSAPSVRPEEVGLDAARGALKAVGARPLPKSAQRGALRVVLTPGAAGEVLPYTLAPAFLLEEASRGQSVFGQRKGEQVASEELQVIDDGRLAQGLGAGPCDDEGTATVRRSVIKDGVLRSFLSSRRDAARFGGSPTGNGVRAGFRSPPSTGFRTMVVRSSDPWTADELIEETRRGVLVHEVMGAHTANRTTTEFSVNASELYYIENGEVRYPLKPCMLAGNLARSLTKELDIGRDHKLLGSGASGYLPSMRLQGLKVEP